MSRGVQTFVRLLALIALLSASLLQGRTYARCLTTHTLHFTACCQVAVWQEGLAFDDPACCEIVPQPALAPAELAHLPGLALPPALPPEPLPALPPLAALAFAPGSFLERGPPPARGPPPPSISSRLARLSRLRC